MWVIDTREHMKGRERARRENISENKKPKKRVNRWDWNENLWWLLSGAKDREECVWTS